METSFPAAGMARQRDVKRMGVIAGMLFWRQGSIVRPGEATTDRQLDQGKPGVGSFFQKQRVVHKRLFYLGCIQNSLILTNLSVVLKTLKCCAMAILETPKTSGVNAGKEQEPFRYQHTLNLS